MSRKKKYDHVSHERWLISYADFITLLFALFVVLFATSQSDHKKVKQMEHSIRLAFQTMGFFPGASQDLNLRPVTGTPATETVMMGDDLDVSPKAMADLKKMELRMEQLLAPQIARGTVAVRIGRDGLIISLREAGFFNSASAIPKATSLPALNAIGTAIAVTPYNVRIEGHTDNVPIHTQQFDSNWELSTARATVLTRLFIEKDRIAANRLAASGYAEYHPVASNSTAQGRSRNRRVDIIILPTRQSALQQTASADRKIARLEPRAKTEENDFPKFLSKAASSAFAAPTRHAFQ